MSKPGAPPPGTIQHGGEPDPVQWAFGADWGACGAHASKLGDAFGEAIGALTQIPDCNETGNKNMPTEIFEFFADPVMCLAVYCVPYFHLCLIGRTFEAGVGTPYEKTCLDGLVTSFLCLGPCYFAAQRTKIREKYGFKGSKGTDFLFSCIPCTAPCSTCQLATAVGRETGFRVPFTQVGHDGPAHGGQVTAPPPMMHPPAAAAPMGAQPMHPPVPTPAGGVAQPPPKATM